MPDMQQLVDRRSDERADEGPEQRVWMKDRAGTLEARAGPRGGPATEHDRGDEHEQRHEPERTSFDQGAEVVVMRLLDERRLLPLEPRLCRDRPLPEHAASRVQPEALVQKVASLADARLASPDPVTDERVMA